MSQNTAVGIYEFRVECEDWHKWQLGEVHGVIIFRDMTFGSLILMIMNQQN
jgi:hypothetical protein